MTEVEILEQILSQLVDQNHDDIVLHLVDIEDALYLIHNDLKAMIVIFISVYIVDRFFIAVIKSILGKVS